MTGQENESVDPKKEIRTEEFDFEAGGKPKLVQITDEELKGMQRELSEYKDKYLRQLAETENTRKRLQKENQEMTRFAIESLVVEWLKPLDDFENALKYARGMSDEIKNWAYGFQMILNQFKDILAQNGVCAFDSLGKVFNPHDHEAIEMVESNEVAPGIIVEEAVRGYKMRERTIRSARVKVSKKKEDDSIQNVIQK